jgi:K+-transporting ATPase ATPase A chain
MTTAGVVRIGLYLAVVALVVNPLGAYMARVYQGERTVLDRLAGPLERLLYRLCRIDPAEEMTWQTYAAALLLFTIAGVLFVYALERLQAILPFNPQGMAAVPSGLSLNTAVSFATNTNWQNYGGESTLSYLTQMAGLTVKNFVSAAAGRARAPVRAVGRQRLDRYRPRHPLHPAAAIDRPCARARLAGGRADPLAVPDGAAAPTGVV